jgi:hypothetical protein
MAVGLSYSGTINADARFVPISVFFQGKEITQRLIES